MLEMPFGPSFSLGLGQANNAFGPTSNFEKSCVWACPPSSITYSINHIQHGWLKRKSHQGWKPSKSNPIDRWVGRRALRAAIKAKAGIAKGGAK